MWIDKSIFEIFDNKTRVYVRWKSGECLNDEYVVPKVKDAGGLYSLLPFGGEFPGYLIRVKAIVKTEQ